MASLTVLAHQSRLIIKYGGIGLVAFVVIQAGLAAAISAYKKAHPPYYPPTVKYGRIPRVEFPQKEFEKKNFNLEMVGDKFPEFKDQARVYVVYRPNTTILALENDTKTAKSFGFVDQPVEQKLGVYQFSNNNLNLTLTMNVLDGSFKISYPYLNDQMLLKPEKLPNRDEAITIAKSYLEGAEKLPADIDETETKVNYWKIDLDGLKAAESYSEGQLARVDFYRKNLEDNRKILPAEIGSAPISVLESGSEVDSKKVIEVNYKYVNIDRESYSTYPIKKVTEAWEELKAGNYWPAKDIEAKTVNIRKVDLAYFEPVTLTNFLQPIYVFEGDKGFTAYVPAIPSSWWTE